MAQKGKGEVPAVLLQHGLTESSDTFVVNDPELSPAYKLLEAGFDVWLGNNRGNKYSRKHQTLDPDTDSKQFFDFSFEDLGKYDLPAQVDYVIKETGRPKISYIGHSQGTAQMFAALADNEEFYAKRINFFGALAPIARIKNIQQSVLKIF